MAENVNRLREVKICFYCRRRKLDIHKFGKDAPGKLVRISDEVPGNRAFVPNDLPPNWSFPPRLWPLVADARQQLGILDGLGRNLPTPAILLRPLEDREAILSSRLEGTYASPKELFLFEMQPREPESEHDRANDWREVFNYRKALHEGMNSSLPISLRLIRNLHRVLLTGVRGKDRTPGDFRRIQVAIGSKSNVRFVPPPANQLTGCLNAVEKYVHRTDSTYDPLVECFLVHYQFETIHPFIDGNGRVGRLLLSMMLQQKCDLSKPWLYLSEFFEKNREQYTDGLFDVSAGAKWEEWIEFCLTGTIEQARNTIQRCERLLEVREHFLKKLSKVGGSVRLNEIIEGIFHSPFVRVADLPNRLHISYPTANRDVKRLQQAGILEQLPDTIPKTYFAPAIFNIAYEDLDESSSR